MDKEESLALFAQGRDAWNAWAAKMLAEREALETAGTWTGREEPKWNDASSAWYAAAKADFSEHQFKKTADFSSFVFPGEAVFSRATFSREAWFGEARFSGGAWFGEAVFSGAAGFFGATFSCEAGFDSATFSGGYAEFEGAGFSREAVFNGATFSGYAGFREATFSGEAVFSGARFSGYARFERVTFSGEAAFSGTTFSSMAEFDRATFSGYAGFLRSIFQGFALFDGVRFEKAADFRAIDGKSGFSLSGATFMAVPDFIQAHFAEAPRLDNSRILPWRFRRPTLADIKNYFKGDRDLSARWRALKRLAIQGHDHMHELEFFKNELKTRRWSTDRPWHAVFWFGLFYGWFSDFGRSILRPLFWWAGSAYVFALLYLDAAKASALLDCFVGRGDPWRAALWISARKALLFFGLDSSDRLTQHYACLYGVISPATSGQLPAGVYLDVPDSAIALGIAQHVISAVLLFFFLLAVRNHFRIK